MKNQNGPDLTQYILNNFEHLEELTRQYRNQKNDLLNSNPLFKDEINSQYKDKIKFLICFEMCRDMACSYDDAAVIYEELELGDLFG